MPTSIRIALVAAILALASNAAVIGFIHWQTYDESLTTLRRQVTDQNYFLADIYQEGGLDALQSAMDDVDADDPHAKAGILDPRGRPEFGDFAAVQTDLSEGYRPALVRLQDEGVAREAAIYLHRLRGGHWLISARIAGEGLAFRQTLQRSLWIGLALALLLGLACGIIVARYVGRTVRAVARVADRIGSGDLRQRVPVHGTRDPFDALARQINAMLDRINTLMDELSILTDALAHDLRSPVGRIRAAADAALSAPSDERREQLLAGIIQQADSLMRILTTILEIGRSEALTSRKQFAWFDAGQLVAELAEMYEPVADEAGASLVLQPTRDDLMVNGHRQLLAQALSNLIENAINHGASGGEIGLAAVRDGDRVALTVTDRGPGIPEAERDEARRRFRRLDSSRSQEGAGLGLALAEAIAHLHGGELLLGDCKPGLRATIEIPIQPDAAGKRDLAPARREAQVSPK
ncbi:MAG TPA: HAMP domain-containing sensor histidine kinase [Sphingomicrobium sp.]|nr:HAMP domain-containing sensor histidine kinase [Sphingomicrobium sp.]